MENLTFNELPKAVTLLYCKLENIEKMLLQKGNEIHRSPDELLTVEDAAKFLTLSVPTIYGLISKGQLPVMKRSKRCYFSKSELMDYLKQGRQKTTSELEREAMTFINRKPR